MTTMLPNGMQAIDQMDRCLDLVKVAYLALLGGPELLVDDTEAIAGTLQQALEMFKPIRTKLNEDLAATWPQARDPRVHVHGETPS